MSLNSSLAQPLVSVIIPVYNAAAYVESALGSIMMQTYQNLEILVFNDGSTDNSAKIVAALAARDSRIVFHDSSINYGYVKHLNKGLVEARGKYIARMDADDIALPERIARQVAYLEAHDEIGACGSWFNIVGRPDIVEKPASTPVAMRYSILANSPMAHPTVVMRADVLREHRLCYDSTYMPAEDYQLWYRISQVSQLANVPEVLLSYRHHAGQISSHKTDLQRACADRTRLEQLVSVGFVLTTDEQRIYCQLVDNVTRTLAVTDYGKMKAVMDKLVLQNRKLKAFPEAEFEAFVHQSWLITIYNVKKYSLSLLRQIFGTHTRAANDSLGIQVALRTSIKGLLGWNIRV
jgi:hypothetical protein